MPCGLVDGGGSRWLKHWLLPARLDGGQNTTAFKHIAYNPVAVEFAVIMYVDVK